MIVTRARMEERVWKKGMCNSTVLGIPNGSLYFRKSNAVVESVIFNIGRYSAVPCSRFKSQDASFVITYMFAA